METKKNPKKDLNRNSGLYFVVGLTLVLGLVYLALEWRTYETPADYAIDYNSATDLLEDVPLTVHELKLPPPPPPPVAPSIIEEVPDDADVIEDVIASTETSTDEPIITLDEVDHEEEPLEIEVDFKIIEEVPIFPGCENSKDKRTCFNAQMKKHIQKHFRYPTQAQEIGAQGRVNTQFTIDNKGNIIDIKFRGPDPSLEKEAVRIIEKLPQMTPGKQRGTAVKVKFTQPFYFKLN
jgi:protein TonB